MDALNKEGPMPPQPSGKQKIEGSEGPMLGGQFWLCFNDDYKPELPLEVGSGWLKNTEIYISSFLAAGLFSQLQTAQNASAAAG